MAREIKFRAWWNGSKMMGNTFTFEDINERGLSKWVNLSTGDILMQYTGIKDKNGKEIYEGDIVDSGYRKHIVDWEDNQHLACSSGRISGLYFSRSCDEKEELEVIGNIYENPEIKVEDYQI